MERPTLEEVKEYFKGAKIVIPIDDNVEVDITKNIKREIHQWGGCFWIDIDEKVYSGTSVLLWDESEGYAKILSYKEPKEKTYKIKQETGMDSITINDVKYIKEDKDSYKITREQVLKYNMKDEFPEVFETKLTVGKWYKDESDPNFKYFVLYKGKGNAYGFFCGKWEESLFFNINKNRECTAIEATEQEVTEALIKEAVKRGYKNGNYNCLFLPNLTHKVVENFHYRKEDDTLYQGENQDSKNNAVYSKGKWAEILETLTIQEAEAKLNCKIV